MKFPKFILALLCVAFVTGCSSQPNPTTTVTAPTTLPATTTEPLPLPSERYRSAADLLSSQQDVSLNVVRTTKMTVSDQIYSKTEEHSLTYSDPNSKALTAYLEKTTHIGEFSYTVREYYSDGCVYTAVEDSRIMAHMAPEQYRARLLPPIILDEALYESVTYDSNAPNIIYFHDPIAPEGWLQLQNEEFFDAYGIAILSDCGKLQESEYTVVYRLDGILFTDTYRLEPIAFSAAELSMTEDKDAYTTCEYPFASEILLQAYCYLGQSNRVQSLITQNIKSQVSVLERNRQVTIDAELAGQNWMAKIIQSIAQHDSSVDGGITEKIQITEVFQNGVYTIQEGNTEPIADPQIDETVMAEHCFLYLSENFFDAGYISGVTFTSSENTSLLTFTCNNEFGEALSRDLCRALYSNEEFLNDLASAYQTNTATAYFGFDGRTGFPTSISISFAGTHTIYGEEYLLSTQIDQLFCLAGLNPFEHITE